MTDNIHNEEGIIEKYREAGRILHQVREEAIGMVRVGASLFEVADFVETKTIELGGKPAFPCNISRNAEAAHATPASGDTTVFGKDIVKLDLGVHVDGYIADSAVTVDLSGNPEIVKAAEEALSAAIDHVRAGVSTAELGNVIEDTIHGFGLHSITNLTGHGLARYVAHDDPTIPNRHIDHGIVLKEGDVIAIEPFATDGAGLVYDGNFTEIYSQVRSKPVRLPAVRKVLQQVQAYEGLPFAKRWLESDKLDYAMLQLEKTGIIHGYPVLLESAGGLVAQAEHTVIVTEDGCEVTTL